MTNVLPLRRQDVCHLLHGAGVNERKNGQCHPRDDRPGPEHILQIAGSGRSPGGGAVLAGKIARNVTVSAWNPSQVFSEGIDVKDYPDYYERTVPKGYVNVSVVAGRRNQEMEGESLVIPDGAECDSLWAHRSLVDCSGEFAFDTAVLHKQFTTVFLKIDNLEDGDIYPYELILRSRFDGLRLTDCSPHPGEWSLPLRMLPDGTFSFRVPRQGDGSLTIDILLDGAKIDSYPIGEHILKAGYSWLSEDLEDIWIGMDYGRSEIHITIESWEDGVSYDAVI